MKEEKSVEIEELQDLKLVVETLWLCKDKIGTSHIERFEEWAKEFTWQNIRKIPSYPFQGGGGGNYRKLTNKQ